MNAIQKFEEDPLLLEFLKEDYNPEVYSSNVIAAQKVSASLQILRDGIDKIDAALEDHVSEHYEDLINQATGMDILEESLVLVKGRVELIQRSMTNIKRRLSEPYLQMQTRTKQLSRLQKSCDVLRRVSRIQYLTKRLRQQLDGGMKEITKASQTFNELDFLFGEGDLKGITCIDKDLQWIEEGRKKVEKQAAQLLQQGLSSLNQNQATSALQVYYSFDKLKPVVRNFLDENISDVRSSLKLALSGNDHVSHGLGPGGTNLGGAGSAAWRAAFWTSLDKWCHHVTSLYDQVHVLHRTLTRKRDTSARSLLEEAGVLPLPVFVQGVYDALEEQLNLISSPTKITLDMDYPKALKYLSTLWEHFESRLKVEGLEDVRLPNVNVRTVLLSHQHTYLARSLNKLLDPISIIFPDRTVPSASEVEGVIRVLISETSATRADHQLKQLSLKNAAKALREIVNRCEGLVLHSNAVASITSSPNEYQIRNLQIPDISEELGYISNEVWLAFSETIETILVPFRSQIEHILSTIHDNNYGFEAQEVSDCSTYINLIEEAMTHLSREYLSYLTVKSVIEPKIREFQDSLLSLYLLHLSVIRPLSDGGKMQLASDIAETERVFLQLLERDRSGEAFRNLRSFRAALFLPEGDIISVKNVPRGVLLHHLFSRAGEALVSPHQVVKWSVGQYVAWLHSHPHEVADMVRGGVQWYEDMIRESGATTYDPIYPIIIELLKQS